MSQDKNESLAEGREPGEHGHPPDQYAPPDHRLWKLNVQGVIIESASPEIVVRDAIKLAGFNPDTPWIVILKVAGEPKIWRRG